MIDAAAIPVVLRAPTPAGRLHTSRTNGMAAQSANARAGAWHVAIDGLVVLDIDEHHTLISVEVLGRPKSFRSSDAVPEWPHDAREADVALPRLRELDERGAVQLLASRGKQRLLVLFGETTVGAEPIKLSKTCVAYVADGLLHGFLLRYDR